MLKNLTVAVALALSVIAFSPVATAADARMVGVITEIKVAADGKTATAVVKNNRGGAMVNVLISDTETLDKFKDKRIVKGDEVRVRYDSAKDNLSSSFRKTAGC
ncbi:MAG: hypothetical protein KGZ43_07740 [Sulfuritalea sp.]|nr:hypothetical protein [Sulfuritalea sp.]